MTRRLIATERAVEPAQQERYLRAWERLASRARERDARAWLFRGADDDTRFIEFLEFDAGADPTDEAEVGAARQALEEAFGRGRTRAWVGVRT